MSPGDLWGHFRNLGLPKSILILMVIHGMFFGNDYLGMHPIFDDATKRKIIQFVEKWYLEGGDKVRHDLSLSAPEHDTSALTAPPQTENGIPILEPKLITK
jgi:hypothetical protein